jgi:zinc transporter ZupT
MDTRVFRIDAQPIAKWLTVTAQESVMSDSWMAIVMGSFVLVIASMFVADHCRREHRRRQLLRNLNHHDWWDWTRH